ncbi:MAG: VWA domain-containing protein [Planctomycetota bacterium]
MILAHPWFLLVFPLPLLVRYCVPPHRTPTTSLRVPLFDLVVDASHEQPTRGAAVFRRNVGQRICYAMVWCLLVLALARPQKLEPPITRDLPTRDLMLAIDLSASMETKDFQGQNGQAITRLNAVQEVLDEFLQRRKGDRVGMIVFGSGAFVQIPFTQDVEVCRELVQQTDVGMAGPKTAMGDAIGLAINVFQRSELDDQVLIVLTDGNDTGSRVPPGEAAKIAHDNGIVIHAIGIGDPEAVGEEAMDEEGLQSVAAETGGRYFYAQDREELESVYTELDSISERKAESISYRPKTDRYHFCLASAFVLSIGNSLVGVILGGRASRIRRR